MTRPPRDRRSPARSAILTLFAGSLCLTFADISPETVPQFTDQAAKAGINFRHINGPADRKDLIFEAKGGGLGFFDYNNDGWMDLLLVQGSTVEAHMQGKDPHCVLYRNKRDGTFEDVTEKAGLTRTGWGMGVSFGDYDNDGFADIYLTFLGPNVLYRNNGNGTFTDVTEKAGVGDPRWSSSAGFGDYDRDGDLDLYVCNYITIDWNNLPKPGPGMFCTYLGRPVMCGPRGLKGARDTLYRNNGDGTFTDVSESSGAFDRDNLYGLGMVWADLENDQDLDIFVANDDGPNLLFVNDGKGKFEEQGILSGLAVSVDGRNQGCMGIDAADYDNDGLLDAFVTNFANDYSTLYHNDGNLFFSDITGETELYTAEWLLVGWGARFTDFNHDGWKDIFHANGHVTPFLITEKLEEQYFQPPSLYLNDRGTFRDVRKFAGPDMQVGRCGRGAAFADYDNDGDTDVAIANLNDAPQLLRNDRRDRNHWIMLRTVGHTSNRDGIGARITVTTGELKQIWEIKRTVSIYSASDPRADIGLGEATKADLIRVQWPSGKVQEFRDVAGDAHYVVDEEKGLSKGY
ncbi:MAG: CRTAC1 family protein [Acidobacteriota bacterium]